MYMCACLRVNKEAFASFKCGVYMFLIIKSHSKCVLLMTQLLQQITLDRGRYRSVSLEDLLQASDRYV